MWLRGGRITVIVLQRGCASCTRFAGGRWSSRKGSGDRCRQNAGCAHGGVGRGIIRSREAGTRSDAVPLPRPRSFRGYWFNARLTQIRCARQRHVQIQWLNLCIHLSRRLGHSGGGWTDGPASRSHHGWKRNLRRACAGHLSLPPCARSSNGQPQSPPPSHSNTVHHCLFPQI